MGEFYFGLGGGHLPKKADRIAAKHGAFLVNFTESNGYKRHWFGAPNLGAPFDSQRAEVVIQDLKAAGII